MMSSGIADGSWELTILVADLSLEKTLRVKGDLHIGGLMLKLVEDLGISNDWSDYGLWWPERTLWLLRTHVTLDQYGVQADAVLHFTPMHNGLHIELPDLQIIDLKVNFSLNVFSVVIKICKELGIRHPEELSLARKLEPEELKRNKGISATRRTRPVGIRNSTSSSGGGSGSHHLSNSSLLETGSSFGTSPRRFTPGRRTPGGTLMRTCSTPITPYGGGSRSPYSPCLFNANSTFTPGSVNSLFFGMGPLDSVLANSPSLPTSEALRMLYRPKNFAEKARINAGWLDSSRSLMEQGILPNNIVLLRFKFFNFYDLNPKYDHVRINQIYEQAKWSLISEELDCTLEEMIMFAALQLQVQIQTQNPQDSNGSVIKDEDHIDAALNELQMVLEGTSTPSSNCGDILQIPELCDYLRFYKRRRFWFQSFKRHYFVFKDTCLSMYRTSVEKDVCPQWTVNLKGCEVTSEILVAASKYNIKLLIPSPEGLMELWLKADTDEQYARWMAAFRLACKGKTMADSVSFDAEMKSIMSLLSMQKRPMSSPSHALTPQSPLNVQPEDYVASRFLKKLKTKQWVVNEFQQKLGNSSLPKGLPSLDCCGPLHTSFDAEMKSIMSLLSMQKRPMSSPSHALTPQSPLNVQPEDYVASRFLKKLKTKQLTQRILDAHASVQEMNLINTKLSYIRAWQALPEYGITYFIVRFRGSKKEELLGVAFNQMVRMTLQTGELLKTWRYQNMKSWSVNWEIKQVNVSFEEEDIFLQCLTADCKIVHEFIGGYIFLSMRSGNRNQTLNEELFHKLTGGWL